MGRKKLKVAELPFLKRYPYGDEREFRVIYKSGRGTDIYGMLSQYKDADHRGDSPAESDRQPTGA